MVELNPKKTLRIRASLVSIWSLFGLYLVSFRSWCPQKHSGRIPYGYRLTEVGKGLEVVEQEAEMLRGILENIAEGSSPYCKANRLNSEGVPALGWHFGRAGRKYGDA
jgi:hypothetical protein